MSHSSIRMAAVDPRLVASLRDITLCGLAVVACLPAARGSHALLGWGPLWLVLMPALAWAVLALRGRRMLPVRVRRRRRSGSQAVARQARPLRRPRLDGIRHGDVP